MASRLTALRRFARGRGFDVALSHASHELPLVARSFGIPSSYAFDYEFALAQHRLGCRAATRVVVPDAIPQARLSRLGARERKVVRYPGLKEEYYLHDFRPDAAVLDELGIDRAARAGRRPDASGGLALPPAATPRSSRTCSGAWPATRTCTRSSFRARRPSESR